MSYYPQTNSQIKKVNQILLSILHKIIHDAKKDWDAKLLTIL